MKIKVFAQDGKQTGTAELSDDLFGGPVNTPLLHQVVTMYAANRRQGTAKAKGRAEVSGGGTKPWRQKGTGHARSGSNTSPIWVRGGKTFGPVPRDYYSRIPHGVRVLALRHALSSRVQAERVVVVESVSCEPAKTKTVATMLRALPLAAGRILLVTDGLDRMLYRCGRNIRDLSILPLSQLNAAEVLRSSTVVLSAKALVGKLEQAVAQ